MSERNDAIRDFERARRRGNIELLLARLTGRSADLLSYEEVRKAVRGTNQSEKGLRDVPVEAIVGSLGRYKDFTHSFMPIHDSDQERWASVRMAAERGQGLPPVELYQIGEAYFVKDGNHRVSIARELGIPFIQAWVTEIESRVPITPDMNADDLILARQQVEFLQETKLDQLRPESNVRVTEPGKYPILLDHIRTHQYYMGIDHNREIGWEEAVTHWYDEVYLKVLKLIRQRGILDAFPDRTETDFYVWLADHRQELERGIGWEISTEDAIESLAEVERVGGSPEASLTEAASPTHFQLINDILVVLGPEIDNQTMLGQALEIATHESAMLKAIYTSADGDGGRELVPNSVQQLYDWVMAEAEVEGRLAADVDDWDVSALERARWNDLIIAPIFDGSKQKTADARWESRWRNILIHSAKPILAVTDKLHKPDRGFLVFTGHQKDQQALFVSTWLASQWGMALTVGIGGEPSQRNELIDQVEGYLEKYQLDAHFAAKQLSDLADILEASQRHNSDLIIASMRRPVWSRFLPSTQIMMLDLLKETNRPVLILN